MTSLQEQLKTSLSGYQFEFDKPLAPLTYFKVGGPAEAFIALEHPDKIAQLHQFCQQNQINLTVLGGGSNVIASDQGVSGVVLQISAQELEETGEVKDGKHFIQADAGLKTALLVSKSVALGYTGLEYFLGVPGTLGGAVYNNSHYLSDLIGEHISRVQIVNQDFELEWLDHQDCDFAYDYSRFHQTDEIIIRAEFALKTGDSASSQEKIKTATEYRAKTQPLGPPSSGCIFQNTPNTPELKKQFPQFADKSHLPAGFLIDQAGLKGTKKGDIEISDKHAAWMINHGQGKAEDVLDLIKTVKKTVKQKFGVKLQEEVFFLE